MKQPAIGLNPCVVWVAKTIRGLSPRLPINQSSMYRTYKTLLTAIVFTLLCGCMSVNRYLVSEATMDSDQFQITDVGKLEIGQTIIIVKPTNALNTFSGQEILMIPQYSHK
jgi:hypothetical protein